ncbi:fructosamine kinase family protein [Albimonas sp. CAU 1670]|uniref:fructosamine kinase family protein n=1 Tax=Albimonas sp. CAU 1670 TaxID=3032599 RepID=UPI0023DC891F|nr:fructosamine kinase family protein [Albimonas sp. CAU 1670]MDF2235653.1 fructosamine kinase family protein [Albimonas sp. CAU 1670]
MTIGAPSSGGLALAREAAALLGARLDGWRRLPGGDLNLAVLVELDDGRRIVAKTGPAPRTEARMLVALRAAGAPTPEVLGASDSTLALEALPEDGGFSDEGWRGLGRMLRRLHETPGPAYGWPEPYAFGPVAIPANADPALDWPAFWGERRLLAEAPRLAPALARRLERLAASLPERLPRRPLPGLLHGDLWSGNLLASGGRLSGLVDPACCHGPGEVDLAMLTLFGAPGPQFAAGYGALDPGAAERRPVYQLWPAIVHLRLFGGGYEGMVEGLLAEARA